MNANKTCLALLLSLFASTAQAEINTTLDLHASKPAASATTARLFSTILPGDITYLRAASFTPATTEAASINATSKGLILDLRSNTTPGDFVGAGRIAKALQGAQMVVVLTNRETRGAAETLTATLQSRGALVMGEQTKDIFPDVTTTVNGREETKALAMIDRQQVDAVITETATRHRMSEAALVKGQDPEQEAFIASHEQAAPAAAPATHDVALVEALDSFKAIRVLQGEESSPQPRVADTASTAGLTVIASSGLR